MKSFAASRHSTSVVSDTSGSYCSITEGNLDEALDQQTRLNTITTDAHAFTQDYVIGTTKDVPTAALKDNETKVLFPTSSHVEENNQCLIEDCNYMTGEIVHTQTAVQKTNNRMAAAITTMAYINTATTPTYSSILRSPTLQQGGFNFQPLAAKSNWPLPTTVTTATPSTTMNSGSAQDTRYQLRSLPAIPAVMPANMDMSTMFQMLTHISNQVALGNQQTTILRGEVAAYNQKVDGLVQDVEDQHIEIKEAIGKFNQCADTVNILASVTTQHDKDIETLKRKIDSMEATSNRNKLIISGLVEKENENLSTVVLTFLKAKLLIEKTIELSGVRRIGTGTVKPVEVTLSDVTDKGLIYKHTKNLKNVTNENGYAYQLRDLLPERLQEEDQRRRNMLRENKKKAKNNTAHNINMSVRRSQLFINNAPFKKRIPAPRNWELLQMDDSERESVQMARVASTPTYTEKDNRFISYIMESSNVQEIKSAYKHLKLKHVGSTHITVAYNLTSENPEMSDYDDNGEIGAGSRILKVLRDNNVVNAAIFLVRYHSGQNLGVRRFEVFKDMAQKAIDRLDNHDNFYASRLPPHRFRIKSPAGKTNKHRSRGRLYGVRCGGQGARGRLGRTQTFDMFDQTDSSSAAQYSADTDTDTEVVINSKS